MDESITALKESLPALKSTHKTLITKLNAIRNAPTTAELTGLIAKLQVANQQKAEKLKGCKDGTIKMMTKEEVDRAEAELKKWRVKRKKRYGAFRTLFDMVMDGCGKKKEDLYEELGLDEDPYKPVA